MKEKILVTGGAGYIGSHVGKLLGEAGYDVVVYDNLSTGFRSAVLAGELVVGDLDDSEKLDRLFAHHNFDGVMHFAGSIIVPESVEDPIKYYNNNTTNSLRLLDCCLRHKVNRFIFSSTAAVYGLGGESGSVSEGSPVNPINPYGRSKLMTEWVLDDLSRSNPDFNFIALRYFNVAGADPSGKLGQRGPEATHLIKVALQTALGQREQMDIFGIDYDTPDGTGIRDYIHVLDLAQAHLDALKYLASEGNSQILNCGYGHGFSVREVISMVKQVSGVDFNVNEGERRAGDSPYLVAIPDRIEDVLEWRPKYQDLKWIIETAYNFEQGIDQLV
jgi:UDP-glucose 4-epimerase